MSSSWYKGSEGSMSSTGKYSADSDLAKEYASLKEDGDSRVDDEEGWREIHRDDTPGSPEEYTQMVKDYAAQGFDVKAIDMDGDNFQHANFAIKPMGEGDAAPVEEAPVEFSDELQQAHDRVNQWESEAWSGQQSQDIFGQSQTVKDGSATDLGKQQKEAAQNLANNYISGIKRDVQKQLTEGIKV